MSSPVRIIRLDGQASLPDPILRGTSGRMTNPHQYMRAHNPKTRMQSFLRASISVMGDMVRVLCRARTTRAENPRHFSNPVGHGHIIAGRT